MEVKKLSLKEIGYKKLVILFLAGMLLIVLSISDLFAKEEETEQTNQQTADILTQTSKQEGGESGTETYYEDKLKRMLQQLDGIGRVEVMITLKNSKELVVLKDTPYTNESLNETDGGGGSRINSNVTSSEGTVMTTLQDGSEVPYVTKEIEAEVAGVLIIAEVTGSSVSAADLVSAAEVLFNVPAHKVKVLKMK